MTTSALAASKPTTLLPTSHRVLAPQAPRLLKTMLELPLVHRVWSRTTCHDRAAVATAEMSHRHWASCVSRAWRVELQACARCACAFWTQRPGLLWAGCGSRSSLCHLQDASAPLRAHQSRCSSEPAVRLRMGSAHAHVCAFGWCVVHPDAPDCLRSRKDVLCSRTPLLS